MTTGTIQRSKPRLRILRGDNANEPHYLSQSLPVASGVTISSGQVISPKWNVTLSQYEWVLGKDTSADMCYIARKDSLDTDVQSAGTLPGLSCAGQFELQTGFFKTGDTYNDGAYLAADGVTGNLKVTARNSNELILGQVTRIRGAKDIAGEDSSVTPDVNGQVLVIVFTTMATPYRPPAS
jgi:hypothetical protein